MEKLVYLNGELVPESNAKISFSNIGILYGATFYESIRTFKHKFFKLEEHMKRLKRSLTYGNIINNVDMNKVEEALFKVLEANIDGIHKDDDVWVDIDITPGATFPMPLVKQKDKTPTIIAYMVEIPFNEYAKCYSEGKHAVTSLYRSIPPQCFEQRCKHRSRLPQFLSKLDIQRVDPDAFSLMLDIHGYITEGTGANIFFAIDDVLYTPTTRNILNGISRQYAIEIAKKLNIKVVEADITLYEAYNAEEAFWTTTSYCILPISMVDGRKIGNNYPGTCAKKLLDFWSREVGVDIIAQAERFATR